MLERNYYTTAEVAEIMGVSKSYAYKIVHLLSEAQLLNAELKEKGFITVSGKVNKNYFKEKTCYGSDKERKAE